MDRNEMTENKEDEPGGVTTKWIIQLAVNNEAAEMSNAAVVIALFRAVAADFAEFSLEKVMGGAGRALKSVP